MAVLANAADGYTKGGYFVLVDGIVGPWFIHLRKKSVSTRKGAILPDYVDVNCHLSAADLNLSFPG